MKNLRAVMPITAAIIDSLRAAFGAEGVNEAIRGGLAGLPTFWAAEAGHKIGTRQRPAVSVSGADMVLGSNAELMSRKGASRK